MVRVGPPAPEVDPDVLMTIAEATRRTERLRFDYVSHTGDNSRRTAEPHRLVSFSRHWHLVAWDNDRDDWRSFRVDRVRPRTPNGARFEPRDPPGGDVVGWLHRQLSERSWGERATVRIHEPLDAVADRVWPGMGVLEPVDDRSCLLHVGADRPWALVWMITSVDAGFTLVEGSPQLREAFRAQAARCLDALT